MIKGLSPQELIHHYLEGGLDPEVEQMLFAQLASDAALRGELQMQLRMHTTVQKDIAQVAVPLAATAVIFTSLGFAVPAVHAHAASQSADATADGSSHALSTGAGEHAVGSSASSVSSVVGEAASGVTGGVAGGVGVASGALSGLAGLIAQFWGYAAAVLVTAGITTAVVTSYDRTQPEETTMSRSSHGTNSSREQTFVPPTQDILEPAVTEAALGEQIATTNEQSKVVVSAARPSNRGRDKSIAAVSHTDIDRNDGILLVHNRESAFAPMVARSGTESREDNAARTESAVSDERASIGPITQVSLRNAQGVSLPRSSAATYRREKEELYSHGDRSLAFTLDRTENLTTPEEMWGWRLTNVRLGGQYRIAGDLWAGVEGGVEDFEQRFIERAGSVALEYTQRPSLFFVGATAMAQIAPLAIDLTNTSVGGQIIPYVHAFVGASEVGPMLRSSLGLGFAMNDRLAMRVAADYALIEFPIASTWYTSQKFGITYGLTYSW